MIGVVIKNGSMSYTIPKLLGYHRRVTYLHITCINVGYIMSEVSITDTIRVILGNCFSCEEKQIPRRMHIFKKKIMNMKIAIIFEV